MNDVMITGISAQISLIIQKINEEALTSTVKREIKEVI